MTEGRHPARIHELNVALPSSEEKRRRDLPKRFHICNKGFSRADVICRNSVVFICSTNRNAFPTESVHDRIFEHYDVLQFFFLCNRL